MMKNYLLITVLLISCQLFSQEMYLNAGKNFTKYDYKNSLGESNPNLKSESGNYYEIGLTKSISNTHFLYLYGLALNDYNAVGGNLANSYQWNTKYLGVKGGFSYSFFPNKTDSNRRLNIELNAGLIGETIIYGKQENDGIYYSLMRQKEFSGLVMETVIGFQAKYRIATLQYLSIGYNFCHSTNLSNTSEEKLSFNTQQLLLGVHFPVN